MNINQYRQEYLASLFGHTYDATLDRTFPNVRKPQQYTDWSKLNYTGGAQVRPEGVYVSSDHHFKHKNIMQYAGRDFASVDHMDEHMIEQHNKTVKPDDVVFLLGDIAFCGINEANKFLDRMNGYKIMVIGNHDWDKKTKTVKAYNVDEIHMSYCMEIGETEVLMTHVPLRSTLLLDRPNVINVHGHIHEKNMLNSRYKNVSVEQIDYTPQLLTDIIK